MDKQVTFRFFDVRRHNKGGIGFGQALEQIAQIADRVKRQAQIAGDFEVRLESLTKTGDILEGEFTRIQRRNLPSEVDGNNRIALSTNNPLGHGVVFRYNQKQGKLGVQYEPRVASPGRLLQYVEYMVSGCIIRLDPIVRDDMWTRFNGGPIKKLSIGIASPENLEHVGQGKAKSLVSSLQDMGAAYEAPNIKIEMSMGGRKGSLSEAVKPLATYIRKKFSAGEIDVTSFKAVAARADGANDEINLLEDILSSKEELPLHDKDPDLNYDIRIKALRNKMNVWLK